MKHNSTSYLTTYQDEYAVMLRRLQEARLEAGLSQEEVAHLLGKNQSFVSRSENGQRRIDVIELKAFADIYNKPLTYFASSA